jgi:5-methylthioadenosine/S-adenosylhomocysteine deaminase
MLLTSDLALVDGEVRADFALRIEGGMIVAAGPRQHVLHGNEAALDLGRRVMIPGTINAHNHSFQSLLRGFGDDLPFLQWRERSLYRFTPRILESLPQTDLRARGTYVGALFAFAEMALCGVTTVCDFFYLNDHGNENARAVIQAARDVGLRLVLARCFYDYAAAPPGFRETPAEATRHFAELHRAFRHDRMVSICPAPHSLHGASPEMLTAGVAAAREAGTRWHIHLSEEKYQVDESLARFGTTPLRVVDRMGLLGNDTVAVHGCWFDEGERDLLAGRGAALVYCPGSNMFLGDGVTDVVDLLRKGARVALGTDGGCSNSRVSVLDEMRSCALLQKVSRLDGAAITAEACFALGTAGGGSVLGLAAGRLRQGECADLCFLDLDDPSLWPEQSLVKNVVYSLSPRAITDVFVGGQAVVRDRHLTRVPLDEVRRKVRELTGDWRMGE